MTDDRRDPLHDDYLWDGSGEPDAEIVRLEALLQAYRHQELPLLLPARVPSRRRVAPAAMQIVTAAASLVLIAGAAWFASAIRPSGWTVQSLAGAPSVAGARIDAPSRLPIGQVVTTDGESRARIDVGSIGIVDVEPNSRVRLITSRAGEHRMSLDRGQIRALIWAPPGRFFVNTPAATAIDLGCAYQLQVDDRGWGKVRVESGWVAFEYNGRESFIPKDAMCATRPGFGPGTPCYEDAPAGFDQALTILDFSATTDVRRRAALDMVLAGARVKDALTLWHLLSRGTPDERARVYDRMAALVPPPPGATRDAIIRGEAPQQRDEWWGKLGLDSASWWRIWKSPWKQPR
jgi:FecR protein